MERKDFIKNLGLAGLGLTLPATTVLGKTFNKTKADCVLIPSETAGPFPLDLTANSTFFRTDIKESKTGVPLNVKLKILGLNNCGAMQNVRVNIWHCDKDGLYSGYDTNNNAGQAGLTYCRGYQMTDANGEVNFGTIFPGWYTGRICHIHFQVYVSSSYSAVSQLTFDVSTKNSIYSANSSLYTKGTDPMTLASDNIFSDGYAYQMATLTPNSTTGGYDAYLEITVNGSGTVGLGHIEKENAKHFSLNQNFPNPYQTQTTIPFVLHHNADVTMEIWDLSGKKVATIINDNLAQGEHSLLFNPSKYGLKAAGFIYQIEVKNAFGTFRDTKMMTAF